LDILIIRGQLWKDCWGNATFTGKDNHGRTAQSRRAQSRTAQSRTAQDRTAQNWKGLSGQDCRRLPDTERLGRIARVRVPAQDC
jgi:hypothetical protein